MKNPDVVCYDLGFARYERAGAVSVLFVFGFAVFERVGNVKSLFGIAWVTK